MGLNRHQLRHLHIISQCHTPALGGVLHHCNKCDHLQYIYHSCRNRHCPSCQGSKREEWIERQQKYLLDVPYYHVVFTIPAKLRSLCVHNPRLMYGLLFKCSWETIATLSKDRKYLGAQCGMTAVLHTWSQNLSLHPHLHCIVPGGGMTKEGNWKYTRSKGKYLFPVKVMAQLFRAILMRELKSLNKLGIIELPTVLKEQLYKRKWVVYVKRPFAKPAHVIEYLGRYTHKIAISNYRIIKVTPDRVYFKWKNYRHGAKQNVMSLAISEFIRRFAMHILPHRFVRIRHYGILSFHGRSKKIPALQHQQGYKPEIDIIVPKVSPQLLKCQKCNGTDLSSTVLPKQKERSP